MLFYIELRRNTFRPLFLAVVLTYYFYIIPDNRLCRIVPVHKEHVLRTSENGAT